MENQNLACEIRAALCVIRDKTEFLQNLQEVARQNTTHIICLNADMLAGRRHAQAAITHAVRAFKEGTAISNTLEMEVLLYAAGSRQCSIAASFGIHEGENRVFVCCYPANEVVWEALSPFLYVSGERWDTIDQQKHVRLMTLFNISDTELEAADIDRLPDLVLERVAHLDVTK